jgi:hypothetical protein
MTRSAALTIVSLGEGFKSAILSTQLPSIADALCRSTLRRTRHHRWHLFFTGMTAIRPTRAKQRAGGTLELRPNSATEIPPNSAMDRALVPDLALFDAPGERIEMRWSSRYTPCTRRLSDPHEVNVPLKNRSKQAQGCCVRRPRLIHETLTRALPPRGLSPFGRPKQSFRRWTRLPRSRIAVNSLQTYRACDRLMLADRLRGT